MSSQGPFGDPFGPEGFGGLPFFADVARMLSQQGPVSWDAARQVALSVATGGQAEPNVDPLERLRLEELSRVADLRVADALGLDTTLGGVPPRVVPVTRGQWAATALEATRPLFEGLASALEEPEVPAPRAEHPSMADPDAGGAWLEGLLRMMNPLLLGMAAGSMVGHQARRAFGNYEQPVPRPVGQELAIVVANLDEFATAWSLPGEDLRLWVCIREVTHHAVFGVPHVRARIEQGMRTWVQGFRPDPRALEERIAAIDPSDPESFAGLQRLLADPEILLGALQTPEQAELRPHLDAIVAVVLGVVDHVLESVSAGLLSSGSRLTEALRRRRVEEGPSSRFTEQLLGLTLDRAAYERANAFVQGVLERAGTEGLALLWTAEEALPTPAEVDAPGLWLARLALPGD